MRYRREDKNSDYVFGAGDKSALSNSPETVAMAVKSRLDLSSGDWFLDDREGTPYKESVLGKQRSDIYNTAIRDRISGTKGVSEILSYQSEINFDTRKITITASIKTVYGQTEVNAVV